jgi:hypothetical protein
MSQDYFYFDKSKLLELADERKTDYQGADPFPHIVLDNFLPPAVLEQVLAEFPTPEQGKWKEFTEATQNLKMACEDETNMGPATRHLLNQFNSSTFLNFLETLTGVPSLLADPHFRGGGLHQTKQGGSLGVHADFNYYKKLKLYRRINVIIYLNKNWSEEFGGHLELWDKDMKNCVQKVLPIFNRVVIFNTDNLSNHGQPDPLTCPEDNTRKSLALYYYTVDSPSGEAEEAHSTIFRARPGQDQDFKKTPSKLKSLAKKVLAKIKSWRQK